MSYVRPLTLIVWGGGHHSSLKAQLLKGTTLKKHTNSTLNGVTFVFYAINRQEESWCSLPPPNIIKEEGIKVGMGKTGRNRKMKRKIWQKFVVIIIFLMF